MADERVIDGLTKRFSLEGQVALVLGGSSGIGRQIALGFGEVGASLALAGSTAAKVDKAIAAAADVGAEAEGYTLDVREAGALERLTAEVVARFGRIDVLLNSQGITRLHPADAFPDDDYRDIIAINQDSVFEACLGVGRQMLDQGSGAIVNIASLASFRGMRLSLAYTMSKHAVLGLTRTLAAEWADKGVRVNAIAPGFFMTPLNQARMSDERKAAAIMRTPAGRFGELEELVGAAIYLASPAAGFVTGETLTVDGGYLASGI